MIRRSGRLQSDSAVFSGRSRAIVTSQAQPFERLGRACPTWTEGRHQVDFCRAGSTFFRAKSSAVRAGFGARGELRVRRPRRPRGARQGRRNRPALRPRARRLRRRARPGAGARAPGAGGRLVRGGDLRGGDARRLPPGGGAVPGRRGRHGRRLVPRDRLRRGARRLAAGGLALGPRSGGTGVGVLRVGPPRDRRARPDPRHRGRAPGRRHRLVPAAHPAVHPGAARADHVRGHRAGRRSPRRASIG